MEKTLESAFYLIKQKADTADLEDIVTCTDATIATPVSIPAIEISVADTGNYYTGTNMEAVLQEVGLKFSQIVENGSNGNGYYRKWSDGRLECWHILACNETANVLASRTWIYPHINYGGTRVIVNATLNLVSATWGFACQLLAFELTTDSYGIVKIKMDYTQTYYVGLYMIGRWKA